MHILVVDDSDDARDVAKAMLHASGYDQVSTAGSASEAYRFLAVGAPATQEPSPVDLVLLDILMPGVDGIETCARIRKEPRHADVPIIMVTSVDDVDGLANAFVAGATDYVTKPVNRVELLARVRAALNLKTKLDRRQARERELLQFIASWGDRRASHWVDDTTGLLVGEVAEAYLSAAAKFAADTDTSVIALAVDHLDAYRSRQGDAAAADVMAQVANAVRTTAATIGVVAGAYRDGLIVLVIPEARSKPALELGEALRASIAKLGIPHRDSIAADHVTASVAVVTGRVHRWIDRVNLLTRAMEATSRVAAAGGNRVLPEDALPRLQGALSNAS